MADVNTTIVRDAASRRIAVVSITSHSMSTIFSANFHTCNPASDPTVNPSMIPAISFLRILTATSTILSPYVAGIIMFNMRVCIRSERNFEEGEPV